MAVSTQWTACRQLKARAAAGASTSARPQPPRAALPSPRPTDSGPAPRRPEVIAGASKQSVAAAAAVAAPPPVVPARPAPEPAQPTPKPAQPAAPADTLWPKLGLLAAAAMWGSYSPAVRLLYSLPEAPDTSVIMAARGVLQAGVLLAVSLAMQPSVAEQQQQQQDVQQPAAGASGQRAALPGGGAELLQQWLRLESPPLWMAALELGLWNYSATALQTLSLQLISATRASFLVQATLLLTPLLSAAAGYRPTRNVWAGCALALTGCLLITADEAAVEGAADVAAVLSLGGDTAILASALFYSLGVVRVSGYARSLPSVKLATGKSVVLGGLALTSLAVAAASATADGRSIASLFGSVLTEPVSWAALLWAGLGPGAIAAYLHIQGQKHVAPAEAQVIFSSKPLWAAAIAWVLLGGEELGPLTWVGGSALVAAGLIASTGQKGPAPAAPAKRQ